MDDLHHCNAFVTTNIVSQYSDIWWKVPGCLWGRDRIHTVGDHTDLYTAPILGISRPHKISSVNSISCSLNSTCIHHRAYHCPYTTYFFKRCYFFQPVHIYPGSNKWVISINTCDVPGISIYNRSLFTLKQAYIYKNKLTFLFIIHLYRWRNSRVSVSSCFWT